jgi:hypothetical protein
LGKLTVELKAGDSIMIGDTSVMLEDKSGQRARLQVMADDNVKIDIKRVKSNAQQARNGISSKHLRLGR